MLLAYHNSPEFKEKLLKRVYAHRLADEITQNVYWTKVSDAQGNVAFRGCAVGCTIHSDDHASYPDILGVPTLIAHIQDAIFENLYFDREDTNREGNALYFPEQFLEAIPVGADLSLVPYKFFVWLFGKALPIDRYTEGYDVENIYQEFIRNPSINLSDESLYEGENAYRFSFDELSDELKTFHVDDEYASVAAYISDVFRDGDYNGLAEEARVYLLDLLRNAPVVGA